MSVKELRSLANAIEAFRAIDSTMEMQKALTFLVVAASTDRDISMKELRDRIGFASSSTSRNIAALSKHHRLGKPGYDLVETYEDLADRRNNLVRLTAKGRALAHRISELMSK
jgi:DNA-binding MarR family transcriptional regulator